MSPLSDVPRFATSPVVLCHLFTECCDKIFRVSEVGNCSGSVSLNSQPCRGLHEMEWVVAGCRKGSCDLQGTKEPLWFRCGP